MWVIEQPEGSAFTMLPRWKEFIEKVRAAGWDFKRLSAIYIYIGFKSVYGMWLALSADLNQVFTTSFWMGAYDGPYPKRHRLWSNSFPLLMGINERGGKLTRQAMAALPGGALARRYVDAQGIPRCVGIKEKLKDSQQPGF